MPAVTHPAHKKGDTFVDYEEKVFEDVKAKPTANDPVASIATDDPDACVFCAYRTACRSRPLRREERFSA